MADISMCKGTNCPHSLNCYRYTATVGMWQSWFTEVPLRKEDGKCDYYWGEDEEKVHTQQAIDRYNERNSK